MNSNGPGAPAAPPAATPPRAIPIRDVAAPTRADASPLKLASGAPDPYRLLFPLGALAAIAGTAPWLLWPLGVLAYPAALHRTLMVQGFELCFVMGFLFTAMPAFTRGERCRPWELATGLALVLAGLGGALAGAALLAHAAFALAVLHIGLTLLRRILGAHAKPPEEFAFVGLGLACGLAGGVLQALATLGRFADPAPNFAARLVSLGMVLSLVLGVGALLVPPFAGIREPLAIPGLAKPHERRGRRALYAALALAFAGAFALEAAGRASAGALLRALAGGTQVLGVWKVWRTPMRRDLYGWALWATGSMTGLGLLIAAIARAHEIAALHVTFVGGFGLLTLGIATRVTISHGRHPQRDESRLYGAPVVACVAAALALRLAAAAMPPDWLPGAYAAAAAAWIAAVATWLAAAFPRLRRTHPAEGPSFVRVS